MRERGTALPIAGARLKAYSGGRPLQPHEPRDDEGRPMAVSDSRGGFRLENIGPGAIRLRSATVQAGRTVIPLLPAMDLTVSVFTPGWMGNAKVTTVAGQAVEVQVVMQKFDPRRR